jgi:hypothetical protein
MQGLNGNPNVRPRLNQFEVVGETRTAQEYVDVVLQPGSRLLVYTDGLAKAFRPEEIATISSVSKTPGEFLGTLMDLAAVRINEKGGAGEDNAAAFLIEFKGPDARFAAKAQAMNTKAASGKIELGKATDSFDEFDYRPSRADYE